MHFPAAQGLGWPDLVQHLTNPGTTGREKPGEPRRAWPWAARECGLREPEEMFIAGGSRRLRDTDRIWGLKQLREQGFSKRQMVLDGSQGEVSRVGSRSPSSPGQGREKSGRSGEEEDFCPACFLTGARGRAGGPDPSPSSQACWLPARTSHADAQSRSQPRWQLFHPMSPHPGKHPLCPSRAGMLKVPGMGRGSVTHLVLHLHVSPVPMTVCQCVHAPRSLCECLGNPGTRGFPTGIPTFP